MLIYNVTVGVDKSIEQEWLLWMKEVHIPNVMSTQMFVGHKIYKVLTTENENNTSYAIQYAARSLNELEVYLEKFAPILREEVQKKFGDKQASFRTLLEEI
jgi:DNA-directed RNA polymerase beta' subunit